MELYISSKMASVLTWDGSEAMAMAMMRNGSQLSRGETDDIWLWTIG